MRSRRQSQTKKQTHDSGRQGVRSTRVGVRVSIGIHSIREALRVRPQQVLRLIVRQDWQSSKDLQGLVNEARRHRIPIEEQSPGFIDRFGTQNQGVVCEISGRPTIDPSVLGSGVRSTIMALDGVEDPHNLGAILRTAWLMGVEAVLVPSDRAVGLVTTVHKVSCGGVEHVPLIEVSNLSNALLDLKEKDFWVFGLAAGGNKSIQEMTLPPKIIWVLGSEDKGLRATTAKVCDELVSIPQLDNAASYNVSVAAGVTLYETQRQAHLQKL